jgi:hypothetical protein
VGFALALDSIPRASVFRRPQTYNLVGAIRGRSKSRWNKIDRLSDLEFVDLICHRRFSCGSTCQSVSRIDRFRHGLQTVDHAPLRIGFAPADHLYITVYGSPSAGIASILVTRQVPRFEARRRCFVRISEKRLSIRRQGAHDPAMANHAPLHSVEVIFYSAASFLLVAAGMAWLFLR